MFENQIITITASSEISGEILKLDVCLDDANQKYVDLEAINNQTLKLVSQLTINN